jgi:hypothetical protein
MKTLKKTTIEDITIKVVYDQVTEAYYVTETTPDPSNILSPGIIRSLAKYQNEADALRKYQNVINPDFVANVHHKI